MATPTSSSNRSKRKTTKPVTKGQDPQRANRQKMSNAKVSNADQRTSTGSAKVTTSKSSKPSDPWKAPTPKTSRTTAPTSNTQFRTGNKPITLPNSRAQGTNLPRAGAQQLRSTTQGPRASSTPSAKPSGSFKAPSIPKPAAAAPKPAAVSRAVGGAGRLLGAAGVAAAIPLELKAMADRQKRWDDYKKREGLDKKTDAQTGGSRRGAAGTRDKPSSALQGRVGNANVTDLRRSQEEARKAQLERANRGKGSSTQSESGSTQSRSSSSSGSGSSRPIPRPQSGPASNAGMKNQNKDFRGNPNRKDSIASTLSELRSMGSGRKVEGVGPVASGSDYAKSKNISQAQSDANKARIKQGPGAKNETLKERMERMKKRRQGTSIGGVD